MTDETQVETPIEDAPLSPPETEAADSSPAVENVAEAEKADDAAEPPPRDEDGKFISPKVQKRIDTLTWEKHQREREAEYWRQEALKYQQPEPPKPVEAKLPKLEEFGYDEAKYQAALIEFATKQAEQVVERRLSEADRQRAEQQRMESFATRQRDFAKAVPDFEDRVLRDPTLPITEAMRDVIVDSPTGPELAYFLATNRETAEVIARLPPHLAALEMGRIDARLQSKKEASRSVTKAPPPPPKVEQTEVPVERNPEDMSADEWMKWREKQLSRKRK